MDTPVSLLNSSSPFQQFLDPFAIEEITSVIKSLKQANVLAQTGFYVLFYKQFIDSLTPVL